MSDETVWEELNAYRMSDADAEKVIATAPGCTVSWTRKDGHPISVWVFHAVIDGDIYLTTTENRPKTAAWKRDPRTSAVFVKPETGAVTVVGRVELSDDPGLRHKMLEALTVKMGLDGKEAESWIAHMDSEGRLTARLVREKLITFDERKISF
jgi:hypothetical protein